MEWFAGSTHTHTHEIFVTTPYDDVINEVLNGLRSPISLFFWLSPIYFFSTVSTPSFSYIKVLYDDDFFSGPNIRQIEK